VCSRGEDCACDANVRYSKRSFEIVSTNGLALAWSPTRSEICPFTLVNTELSVLRVGAVEQV
jgi:hypothetical protein